MGSLLPQDDALGRQGGVRAGDTARSSRLTERSIGDNINLLKRSPAAHLFWSKRPSYHPMKLNADVTSILDCYSLVSIAIRPSTEMSVSASLRARETSNTDRFSIVHSTSSLAVRSARSTGVC